MNPKPTLSICIPTYNRRDRLIKLVESLLSCTGSFEVCIHIDGSTDGTLEALQKVTDSRLHYSHAANQGRTGALIAAIKLAKGTFTMIFDDDDLLFPHGLQTVLEDCRAALPEGSIGYIYHFETASGTLLGSAFPVSSSNLIALRADHGVTGDKKEVVLTTNINSVEMLHGIDGPYRRAPTSLLWSRLSLRYNVVCRNEIIGKKDYLPDGMSKNIRALQRRNGYPMFLLYGVHVTAFLRKRYRSLRFFFKALVGFAGYGTLAALNAVFFSRGRP